MKRFIGAFNLILILTTLAVIGISIFIPWLRLIAVELMCACFVIVGLLALTY